MWHTCGSIMSSKLNIHIFVVAGELYTWGCGNYGRLGHGNSNDQFLPTLVVALQEHKIISVSCGTQDAHTMAVTERGQVKLEMEKAFIMCKLNQVIHSNLHIRIE